MTNLFFTTILVSAVGSGLMSGLFFTFSNFVMRSLATLPPQYGSSAMQSINVTIVNPWFLVIFLGTALGSIASAVIAILNWNQTGAGWMLCGAICYLAGCMAVTICFNVPLNDQLAAIKPEDPASHALWEEYLAKWMPWNHLRTFATLAATTSFIGALCKLNPPS